MLAARMSDLSARSTSPSIKRAEDAVQAAVSASEFKSLPQVARVGLNEWHQSSAGAHYRHVIFLDRNSSNAVSMTGSFGELSHVGKSMEASE